MIVEFYKDNAINYKFDDDADQVLKNERDDLSGDINDAINDGETPPPKSKKLDLLPRLAAALHVLVYTMECALAGHEEAEIPITISKDTLEMAKFYLEHVESQKYMFCEVRHKKTIIFQNSLIIIVFCKLGSSSMLIMHYLHK